MSIAVMDKQAGVTAGLQRGDDGGVAQCRRLQAYILENIALARAMQLEVCGIDDEGGLRLTAPLISNINDKQNAFGGSIGSLLMLSGWGWLQLANEAHGFGRNVVIHKAQITFELPVTGDLIAVCSAPSESAWQRYSATYQKRQRARLALQPVLLQSDGTVAASMQAEYVATQVK